VTSLRVPLANVSGDDVQVAVDHAAHVSVRAALARVDDGKAQNNGYTVERTYLDSNGGALAKVKAGDIVTVQLVVNAKDMHKWIALVDRLPAGFEPLEAKLASGGADADPAPKAARDPWGSRWADVLWDHQDMRDDRVEWFADVMRPGRYTVTYRARATIAGTFFAAPAHVEAMYAPEVNGRSESTVVTVEK
jgi:uncharacterized protein YfaS (alpha-2-macroglobulin family)